MNAPHDFPANWRGAVLAGGESRRMGRDKALLECCGEALWKRQLRVLRDCGIRDAAIVRRPGQPAVDSQVPHIHDVAVDAGPLAGLHAALASSPCGWLVVLAVDMPAIDAGWFEHLGKYCGPGAGAVARHAGGFEPLAAIYPGAVLEMATHRIATGQLSLQSFVGSLVAAKLLAVVSVPDLERQRFQNWNTPDALRRMPHGPHRGNPADKIPA